MIPPLTQERSQYEIFSELHNFPPGHQRYFLTQQL